MDTTKIIEAALGNTPMHIYIRKHPIFAKIIASMLEIPFKDIKREEIYLHGDEYLLKDGEKEKDPSVSFSEKCIYINRVLSMVADSVGSGIVVMDGDLYYYDGCKWVNMPEQIASNFLSLIATKSGLYNSMVFNYKVKKNMFKQLSSDLIKQETTQG